MHIMLVQGARRRIDSEPHRGNKIKRAGRWLTRRSWSWWLQLIVAVALLGLGTVWGMRSLVSLISSSILGGVTKVIAPGEAQITLPDSGTYTINYEYLAVVNGRRFDTSQEAPTLKLELISSASDAHIPVHQWRGIEYQGLSSRGMSIADFTVDPAPMC